MPLTPLRGVATSASKATDETTTQQEGAGQNPARFAADALQGDRAKDALFAVADDRTPLPSLVTLLKSTDTGQNRLMVKMGS